MLIYCSLLDVPVLSASHVIDEMEDDYTHIRVYKVFTLMSWRFGGSDRTWFSSKRAETVPSPFTLTEAVSQAHASIKGERDHGSPEQQVLNLLLI